VKSSLLNNYNIFLPFGVMAIATNPLWGGNWTAESLALLRKAHKLIRFEEALAFAQYQEFSDSLRPIWKHWKTSDSLVWFLRWSKGICPSVWMPLLKAIISLSLIVLPYFVPEVRSPALLQKAFLAFNCIILLWLVCKTCVREHSSLSSW